MKTMGTKFFVPAALCTLLFLSMPQPVLAANGGATTLDRWIDQLVGLESQYRAYLKVLDNNGRHSYGCLQFQMSTFIEQIKKYHLLPNVGPRQLMNAIYNCRLQKQLAKVMIQADARNWRRWKNSVIDKGLGLPPV